MSPNVKDVTPTSLSNVIYAMKRDIPSGILAEMNLLWKVATILNTSSLQTANGVNGNGSGVMLKSGMTLHSKMAGKYQL
jgi:hypothetical protein